MERAKTIEQYVSLVDEVLGELADIRLSAEYDPDSMGEAFDFVINLESQVKKLRQSMSDGSYVFANDSLPFMELVQNTHDRLLPCKHLFWMIDATHRQGLAIDEEE